MIISVESVSETTVMERAFNLFLGEVDPREEHAELYQGFQASFSDLWDELRNQFYDDSQDNAEEQTRFLEEELKRKFELEKVSCGYSKYGQLQLVDHPLKCGKRHVKCNCYFSELVVKMDFQIGELEMGCELRWNQENVKIGTDVLFSEPVVTKEVWNLEDPWDNDFAKDFIKKTFFGMFH